METIRTMLFAALALVLFMMYQAWQKDYGSVPPATNTTSQQGNSTVIQNKSVSDAVDMPSVPVESHRANSAVPQLPSVVSQSQQITVNTDVYELTIDTRGGDIVKAKLPQYPNTTEPDSDAFLLMDNGASHLFIAQSGLLGKQSPDHTSSYSAIATEYSMQEGENTLKVTLFWQGKNGLRVNKVYTFYRGRYDFDLTYQVINQSREAWNGSVYRQYKRSKDTGVEQSSFIYTFTGGVVSNAENPYEKISYDDMQDKNIKLDMTGGWVAMIQHYFLAAWIANPEEKNHVYTKVTNDNKYVIGMVTPAKTVASNETKAFKTRVFMGPKLQDQLAETAPNLALVVDYGWLTILADPLFWLLKWFYSLFGNWGWAIIAVTAVIKLVFFKLSETSYRSMAKLRVVTPRLTALKERYADDKQGFQRAMMKMYQEEKINPLGGCLPILIQIPVFIALYWVLLESVEMRQAPFILWLDDLSKADPYFVLPLLMGATMLLQQRLNPAPLDPIQKKVMNMLPIVFTVFFAFFPSGLVLYWVVNNTLSIAQQWVITKRIEAGEKK